MAAPGSATLALDARLAGGNSSKIRVTANGTPFVLDLSKGPTRTYAIGSINVLDPTSEIARFEEKVRREEALALGQAEVAASSLDSQFAELELDAGQIEVEARLAALKNRALGGTQAAQIEAPEA